MNNNQLNYKRNELIGKHNRRLKRITLLNQQLKAGLITYEEYSRRYDELTNNKPISHHENLLNRRLDQISNLGYREKSKIKLLPLIFGLIMLPALIGIGITGFATTGDQNVTATLTISNNIAGSLSYSGVTFTDTNLLGDNNATLNNLGSSAPGYTIELDDSTTVNNLNVCINGTDLTSGSNTIDVSRIEVSSSLTGSSTIPAKSSSIDLSTSRQEIEGDLDAGETLYQRYWLDLSGGTQTGTYTGTSEILITENAC